MMMLSLLSGKPVDVSVLTKQFSNVGGTPMKK
jgi:hypothetical protein